jgi:hypothetical protein
MEGSRLAPSRRVPMISMCQNATHTDSCVCENDSLVAVNAPFHATSTFSLISASCVICERQLPLEGLHLASLRTGSGIRCQWALTATMSLSKCPATSEVGGPCSKCGMRINNLGDRLLWSLTALQLCPSSPHVSCCLRKVNLPLCQSSSDTMPWRHYGSSGGPHFFTSTLDAGEWY